MKEILTPILVILAVIGGFMWVGYSLDKSQCANNVQEMGRNYRYDFINGCRIQTKDGKFIYWKMFIEFNQE